MILIFVISEAKAVFPSPELKPPQRKEMERKRERETKREGERGGKTQHLQRQSQLAHGCLEAAVVATDPT